MPGVIPLEDAADSYAERLKQHAQSVWDTIANAPQQVAQTVQPAFQAASAASQNIQPIVPSVPAGPDPSAVQAAQQSLLQHAQDTWSNVSSAVNPQATTAQTPQEAPQAAPAPAQPVDQSAVNDASQRLLQHANDTWQSIGSGLSQATAPAQAVSQGLTQATSPTATNPTVTPDQNASPPDRSMSYQDYAKAAAQRAGIDPNVFIAQIQQESGFNPTAKSGAGALGIAQFMPATAAGMHVDPTDPYAALDAAAKMDAANLQKYNGDYAKTLAAYNAGGGAVDQYGGVPPYQETQNYVSTILGNAKQAAGNAVNAVRTAVAPPHAPSTPDQTDGTQIANQPNASGQIFPLAVKPDNAPTSTYHSQGGSDLMAPRGTPVLNMQSGKVEEVFTDNGSHTVGGNAVLIHGDDGLDYYYAHFDQPTALKVGQTVGAGEQIGAVGNSGNAYKDGTGPTHLHIGIGHGISNGVGSEGGLGENFNAQKLLTDLEPGVGQASGGATPSTAVNPDVTAKPTGAPSGPIDSTVQTAQQGWNAITGGLQAADQALQDLNRQTPGTAAVQAVQSAVHNAQQAVTDLGTGAQQAISGAAQGVRTAAQQAADQAGQGLPDITGTLTPDAVPGGAQSPLGKIAQGQKVTPAEQLEAAGQTALGYEQSRGQAAANLDPLRNLPGGNVIGPTVEQLTDPASWVGVGSVKSAIGVAASVAASVGAQQVAQNLIPDDDPNKGVKVALVSLLGAFTGGPVGERTIAPLVDRANTLVSSLGTEGASQLVQRAADVAGDKLAPAVSQFVSEELGAAGHPADVAAERARQAGFTAPAAPEVPTTRMFHGTGADFPIVDPSKVAGEGNLFGPGYYLTTEPRVAGGVVARGGEPIPGAPRIFSSASQRGPNGELLPVNPQVQPEGAVLNPGYAQQRGGGGVIPSVFDQLEGAERTLAMEQTFLERARAAGNAEQVAARTGSVDRAQAAVDALRTQSRTAAGPNVRALDVPQNLNLFDADAPVPEGTLEAINRVLTPEQRSAFEDSLHTAQVFASSGRSIGGQPVRLSGTDVYEALGDALRQAPPDETGTVAWAAGEGAKSAANRVLADAGYDGITYAGGKRIPMADASGAPIEHQATVVFPDSLEKIRNAISGTQGGQANVGYAARLGGAAAGGVAGYQTTPDDASPQERVLRTAGGAVAGFAGVAAAGKVARALTDILKPDLAAPQLEQAIKTVNESDATAPQIAAALDQVRKMPGTAELAPVRQQVPQSSTDLLQAMLDAARAKGADPDKLSALEQQITKMDPTAATRRALTDTGGVRGALGSFLTGDQSELGAVSPRLATTLGGAAAGGLAGNATTPEDASTPERAMRILAGAGIGAGVGSAAAGLATSRGILPQQVLENLRAAGVQVDRGVPIPPPSSSERLDWLTNQGRFAPPEPPTPRGPIARAVDVTKQALLSNPATHTAYVIGNVLELLRSPAALAMGGRGDDAIAGMVSVGRGIGAASNAAKAAFQGQSLPTLAHVGTPTGGPVYRVLGAVHAFSRTLGEYQGMAQEASRLLREADIAPNDPEAAAYLAAHANNIYDAGLRTGAGAVFMRPNSEAQGGNFLENMFRRYNSAKEGFLASPDLKQQALGGLMDFAIPFSGIPTQLLKVAANRLPVASQATGAIRAIKAGASGDMAGMQRAIGETGLESTIQLMIAKQIADGNITGADDPDHPDSIRLNGNWVDMKDAGGWTLPMRIMASWADGYAKGGQNIPAGTPGASPLEQTYNYYSPRFSAALTASMKPFAQAVPGENMMRLLADAGSGQGDVGRTALGLGQNITSRFTPGIARFAENLTDPVARDIDKKGVDSLWKGPASNIPGLAEMLPAKIDPTTGEATPKASSGLGIFLGAKNDVASPLTIEASRLNKLGLSVTAPKTYPTEVTISGSKVPLSPDEQRAVAEITGSRLDQLAGRLNSPEYQNAPDARKAQMINAMITAADAGRVNAVRKVLGGPEVASRVRDNRQVAGQLVSQAEQPQFDPLSFFSQTGQGTLQEQRAAAGVR